MASLPYLLLVLALALQAPRRSGATGTTTLMKSKTAAQCNSDDWIYIVTGTNPALVAPDTQCTEIDGFFVKSLSATELATALEPSDWLSDTSSTPEHTTYVRAHACVDAGENSIMYWCDVGPRHVLRPHRSACGKYAGYTVPENFVCPSMTGERFANGVLWMSLSCTAVIAVILFVFFSR